MTEKPLRPFKSAVSDYAELRKNWRRIGSALPLPVPGTVNGVDISPAKEEGFTSSGAGYVGY